MKLQRIVAATDLSEPARVAVDQAATLARHHGAELVLLCGVERIPYADLEAALWQQLQDDAVRAAHARLAEIERELGGDGLRISIELVEDATTPALIEAANHLRPDLVVVGSRGNTGVKRFLLGSVAEKVVRRAACSVLVARPARGDIHRAILVATDFSPEAEAALADAVDLAADGAAIELYHAYHLPPGALGFWGEAPADRDRDLDNLDAAISRDADRRGRELAERYQCRGIEIGFRAERAPEREGIVARLEAERFDLAVVGSHDRRGVARWLIGSVAEGVVRHAPCSVLVVRTRESE